MPVLAVTGPSGCGKTSLAKALAGKLALEGWRATLLHQDDYFITARRPGHSYWDWLAPDGDALRADAEQKESPEALDMDALCAVRAIHIPPLRRLELFGT